MSVAKKMVQVMENVGYLQKDKKVEFGNTRYGYLSEEKLTSTLHEQLVKVGLIMYPLKVETIQERTITTKSGETNVITIKAIYRIQDSEDDSFIDVETFGEGADAADKRMSKAMASAFKYMQRQSFCISTGDDPDGTPTEELLNGKNNNKGNNKNNNKNNNSQNPAPQTPQQTSSNKGQNKILCQSCKGKGKDTEITSEQATKTWKSCNKQKLCPDCEKKYLEATGTK